MNTTLHLFEIQSKQQIWKYNKKTTQFNNDSILKFETDHVWSLWLLSNEYKYTYKVQHSRLRIQFIWQTMLLYRVQ